MEIPMVTKDEDTGAKAPASDKQAEKPQSKPSEGERPRIRKPDHSVEQPDPDAVMKATAKAEAARDKLAKKNAVSVSKGDDEQVLGVATEHFNIARSDHYGIEVLNISKRGYVGPAQLTLTGDELSELQDALDKFE